MNRSPITLTNHAIEQYASRHARGLTFEQAKASLEEALPRAEKLQERASGRRGGFQWQLRDPDVVLVTQLDPGAKQHVCVTVLPARTAEGFSEDELAILEDAEYEKARIADLLRAEQDAVAEAAAVRVHVAKFAVAAKKKATVVPPAVVAANKKVREAVAARELASHSSVDVREREKTIRHAHSEAQRNSVRDRALRLAVRALWRMYLGKVPEEQMMNVANRVLTSIAAIEPGLATEAYATVNDDWPLHMEEKPERKRT